MDKQRVKLKAVRKIIVYAILLLILLLCAVFRGELFPFKSLGIDTTNVVIEASLQKYINYYLSNQDKGTLVQYHIKSKIEYGKGDLPVKEGQIIVNLNQIDNQYPYKVKVFTKDKTEYDVNTGTLVIQSTQKDDTSYTLIAYYDTYTENNDERELQLKVEAVDILSDEENTQINNEEQYNVTVTENIGKLTSIHFQTQDIYNGYMKSNMINKTNYATQYQQLESIMISKKEAQETIEMLEKNTFMKQDVQLENNSYLVYRNTQIQKSDIEELLGEEGTIDILDVEGNIIATINQDTEFSEEGIVNINYENEPEAIIVKTSHVKNEGILNLKHTKEIKNTMTEIQNTSIKTTIEMKGKEDFYESVNEIKEAQTDVNLSMNTQNWTNEQQNELTFDISLNASNTKNNMFHNPCVYIELPRQVEKVVLGNASILYANGLELQEPYLATNENGRLVIVVNLTGLQTRYNESELGLATDVKIEATIILNKKMESTSETVKVMYANQYTLDNSVEMQNREIPIQLKSYQEEMNQIVMQTEERQEELDNGSGTIEEEQAIVIQDEQNVLTVNKNDLKMEVTPTKGEIQLQNDDIVYEGEYIKYSVKVTNTSNHDLNDVIVVASIPSGVTYGELEAEYFKARGKYEYNFDKSVIKKNIEIGELKSGESVSKFYEVKVDDLKEEEKEKQIISTIQTYVAGQEVLNYQLRNIVKQAEVQVFLAAVQDNSKGRWNYNVEIKGQSDKEVTLKLKLPKAFNVTHYVDISSGMGFMEFFTKEQLSEDNVVTLKVKGKSAYSIQGNMIRSKLPQETEDSQVELMANASIMTDNNISYQSNENRIIFAYPSVSIQMTSDNEGEEVKYGEEINYDITITNLSKTNFYQNKDEFVISVKVQDYLPKEIEPISVSYETLEPEFKTTENGDNELTGYKKAKFTKDISARTKDENGKANPDINLSIILSEKESTTLHIKTKAGLVDEKTKTENTATVEGTDYGEGEVSVKAKTSNTISHTILPFDYIENTNKPNNADNSNKPNDSNTNELENENNGRNSDKIYQITGTAWLDQNEDGKRTLGETLLDNITVMLVDTLDASTIKSTTKTDKEGNYQFSNLEQGNYIVVFRYDIDTYTLTEYQKSDVDGSSNSDAIKKTITLNGEQVIAGVTDVIKLNSSIRNIDIGLIKNKSCDFKINKYISKVIVNTKSGTKEYNYDNASLVKTEIKAKEMKDATVVIEYKIIITNEGEIAGTVNKILDYLPEGLSYLSNTNANWSTGVSGELINTSLSNRKIEVGESVALTLIATKQMATNATGTFSNKVEIESATSTAGLADNNSENNISNADVIISVSTGAIYYMSIISFILIILGLVAIYLYKKGKIKMKKISKITFMTISLLVMVIASNSNVQAAFKDKKARFNYKYYLSGHHWGQDFDGSQFSHVFGGNIEGYDDIMAKCINQGVHEYNSHSNYDYEYLRAEDKTEYISEENINLDINLSKIEEGSINIRKKDNFYLLGPFKIHCNERGVTYRVKVTSANGGASTNLPICNSLGKEIDINEERGEIVFYLKIPNSNQSLALKKVELTAMKKGEKKITRIKEGYPVYAHDEICNQKHYEDAICTGRHQHVQSLRRYEVEKIVEFTDAWGEKTIAWTDFNGFLEVVKVDKDDTSKTLPGVKVKLIDSSGNVHTETTDFDGRIVLENIPSGKCKIIEIENPIYGYEEKSNVTAEVDVGKGAVIVYKLENEKQTGNLKIEKVDADNNAKLAGVSFKLKGEKGGYVVVMNQRMQLEKQVTGKILVHMMQYTDNVEDATEFITDDNGVIEIYNLLKDNYVVTEMSVGDRNNYYYELDDDYILWGSSQGTGQGREAYITVNRRSSLITSNTNDITNRTGDILTVGNRRKYIDLSGYVWHDIEEVGKDAEGVNGLYRDNEKDKNDRRVEGITVQLKDKEGNIVDCKDEKGNILPGKKTTDSDGMYKFKRVEIDKLPECKIEFTYNGMSYQCVNPTLDIKIKNGSRASEKGVEEDERSEFNSKYETITYQKSNAYELKYETSENESKLLYGDKSKYNYGYEENKEVRGPVSGVDKQYIITADTYRAYGDNYIGAEKGIMTPKQIRVNGVDEIENINLGIESREQIDLSLVKDLDTIHVGINHAEHVYKYADRYKETSYGDPYRMEPQVKFGKEWGEKSYTRGLYASDVYADSSITDDELCVKVTYKIGIKSDCINLKTLVNELEDYYDAKYLTPDKIKVGTEVDKNGNILSRSKLETEFDGMVNSEGNAYYKIKIKGPIEVKEQLESYVYVQLEVPQEKIKNIVETDNKFYNYAEITSYSTKKYNEETKKDDIYASIDTDSQPGNFRIDKKDTYEDDTDKAPGLQLVLQEERKINGKVFIDTTTGELKTEEIRSGDGEYKDGEPGVKDVEIQLLNQRTNDIALRYNQETKVWENDTITTNINGDFEIGGFIPDLYCVLFTWGGQTYTYNDKKDELIRVQDYKGTIYREAASSENDIEWYKNRQQRLSDAKDDFDIREKIDNQDNLLKNSNKQTILNYQESGQLELSDGERENLITKMDSTTLDFRVNLEYDDTKPSDVSDEYELNSDGSIKMNGIYAVKKDKHKNWVRNVDFGIVERARQVLKLDKDVEKVKITLANGMVLMDAKIVEKNGKKTFQNEVTSGMYIPKSPQANGQVKFEIDNEIVQGAHVEIEYALKVTNISEKDYKNKSFYWYGYGQNENELVTLKVENVIDYLDNKVSFNATDYEDKGYVIQNNAKKKDLMTEQGTQGLLENSKEISYLLNQTQQIFMIDKAFGKPLKPEKNPEKPETFKFKVDKLLSNVSKDENSSFDNNAEIVKSQKTWGAPLLTIPGNYVSNVTLSEYDNDDAETVVIVPPTGLAMNYIVSIIGIISVLGITVAGIVLIKKYVLK